MPSTTGKGYRYQLGSDPVKDLATGIQNLATDVDSKAGVLASGKVTITFVSTGTPASQTITFPAGRFGTAPNVSLGLANPSSNAPQNFSTPAIAGVSTTGGTIWCTRTAGAAATIDVYWIAHL
jgi:hypothetical protein